jgi:hypothetical protein
MKKVIGVYLAAISTCFIFVCSVLFYRFSLEEVRLGEWLIITVLLALASVFVLFVFFALSRATQAFFWVISGYKRIAFLFYPFLIIRDNGTSVRMTVNFVDAFFETVYPRDLIAELERDYSEQGILDTLVKYEICGIFAQLAIVFVIGIAFIVIGSFYLLSTLLATLVLLYFYNTLNTALYHGSITRIKYLKAGYAVYYLAATAITVSVKLSSLYEAAEEKICSDAEAKDDFGYFRVRILKHLYMLKTNKANIDYEIRESTKNLVSRMLDRGRINLGSAIGSETWDFMKVYMCYAMICEEPDALERVLAEMQRLFERYKPLMLGDSMRLNTVRNLIQWYIDVGRHKRVDAKQHNSVIRKDGFFYGFPSYRGTYDAIVSSVEELCSVYEG